MIALRGQLTRLPSSRRQQLRRIRRRPRWGNLRRGTPLSATFGFDRGMPIDRFYLERFLAEEASAIQGVVGEVAESRYAVTFGGHRVDHVEVIDIDASNPHATIVADLSDAGGLPAGAFDCLLVVQTLQYTPSPEVALANCLRSLRPGGVLLLAVPALAAHDDNERPEDDHWRFWPGGVVSLLSLLAPEANSRVVAYGNLTAAIAFLHGLAAEELRDDELTRQDQRFPVVVCARVTLPVGPDGA
jgi:SAM-dependent methyltransferase